MIMSTTLFHRHTKKNIIYIYFFLGRCQQTTNNEVNLEKEEASNNMLKNNLKMELSINRSNVDFIIII